jgi:hypothetical protein
MRMNERKLNSYWRQATSVLMNTHVVTHRKYAYNVMCKSKALL